jgi:ATP-binding cassette subfamily C protein CydD
LPHSATLVRFRRQEAEAQAMASAAAELRVRTMKVLRVAFLSSAALEVLAAAAIASGGVITLAWSPAALPAGRIPGVTRRKGCG